MRFKSILEIVKGEDRGTEVKIDIEELKELTRVIWKTSSELERLGGLLERLEKGEVNLDVTFHLTLPRGDEK